MASISVEAMREDVASIFLSYLNRAPEYSAMNYFVGRYIQILEELGDAAAAEPDAFKLLSAEIYKVAGELGEIPNGPAVTDAEYVAWLYENVLGRAGEEEGLAYWTAQIESHVLERAELVAVFIGSAQGDDAQYIANRTAVALEFAKFENSNDGILDSLPFDAAQVLEDVTADEATVDAALEKVVTGAVTGASLNLTPGEDDATGTAINDVFTAVLGTVENVGPTLTAFDKLDGLTGQDTLDIYSDGATAVPVTASIQNIETVNLRYVDGVAEGTVQAGRFAGVQQLWQIGAATDVAGVGAGTLVGLRDVTLSAGSSAIDVVAHVVQVTAVAEGDVIEGFTSSVTIDGEEFSGTDELDPAAAFADLLAAINQAGLGIQAVEVSSPFILTLTAEDGTQFEAEGVTPGLVITQGSEAVDAVAANDVGIGFTGASGQVELDGVGFAEGEILASITASGTALASLNISGTLEEDSTLQLDVAAGAGVTTFTLNSDVDTVLGSLGNVSGKPLSTLDAAGTTGDLVHEGAATLANIASGSGDDDITLSTAFSASLKSASVDGGAGDDRLLIQADNTAAVAGAALTVSGGAGADEIIVDVVSGAEGVKVTVDAGEGDDIVRIQDGEAHYRALTDNDVLDGGDGTDTLVVGVAEPALNAGDYVRLQDVAGFETLRFAEIVGESDDEVDASELGNFSQIELAGGDGSSYVKDIAAEQTIVTRGNAVLSAVEDGQLNVIVLDEAKVSLEAKTADVTVDTTEADADVDFCLTDSELEGLTLTLVSSRVEDSDYVAFARVDADAGGEAFASLVVGGTGSVEVDNQGDGVGLTTINTSALGGTDADGAAFAGLKLQGNLDVAENVSVGAGLDDVTVRSQAGSVSLSHMDTYTGLNLVLNATEDGFAATSDRFFLDVESITDAQAFVVGTFETVPGSLGAALNTISALEDDAVVFAFGDDTYIYVENTDGNNHNGNFEAGDFVVKLTGAYDLDDVATLATLSFLA